jgi:hypothetical protein
LIRVKEAAGVDDDADRDDAKKIDIRTKPVKATL